VDVETEDGRVLVQAYLLPTEDEISAHHEAEGPETVRRALELIGLHGKRNETQGLFIYRHDRLIKWGGWHQIWATNDEKTKLARVIVNFDKVLDDAFKINISKQIVQLPQQLQAEIKKIADVARKDSQKKYRKESRVAPPSPPPPITPSPGGRTTAGGVRPAPNPPGAGPTGAPFAHPTPPPRVSVKDVKTEKFVWKVAKGLTGTLDVQVSDLNPHLSALVRQVSADPHAIAHLAAFLDGLDEVDAQKYLMARKDK